MSVPLAFVELLFGDEEIPLVSPVYGYADDDKLALLLSDFSYEVRAGSGNSMTLRIVDPFYDRLERLLIEGDLRFRVRFGWRYAQASGELRDVSAVVPVFAINWTTSPVGGQGMMGGMEVEITAVDSSFQLAQQVTTAALDPSLTITQAIERAVLDSGVPGVRVDIRAASAIPITQHLNLGNNMSVLAYIQHLLRFAPDLTMYTVPDGNDTLLVIDSLRAVVQDVQAEYTFGREANGRMMSFTAQYMGQMLRGVGVGRVAGLHIDAETKRAEDIESVATDYPISEAPRRDETPTLVTRRAEFPAMDRQLIEAATQGWRLGNELLAYTAAATVRGDPTLRIFVPISVLIFKGRIAPGGIVDSEPHHTSGRYTPFGITHTISAGAFQTALDLRRTASYLGRAEAPGAIRGGPVHNVESTGTIRPVTPLS